MSRLAHITAPVSSASLLPLSSQRGGVSCPAAARRIRRLVARGLRSFRGRLGRRETLPFRLGRLRPIAPASIPIPFCRYRSRGHRL